MYFLAHFVPVFFIFMAACETEQEQVNLNNMSACHLENLTTGQHICMEMRVKEGATVDSASACANAVAQNPSIAIEHINEPCPNSSAVNGRCVGDFVDGTIATFFYYPEFDESSAESYCNNTKAPFAWTSEGEIVANNAIFAREDLPENFSIEDFMNDVVIKLNIED